MSRFGLSPATTAIDDLLEDCAAGERTAAEILAILRSRGHNASPELLEDALTALAKRDRLLCDDVDPWYEADLEPHVGGVGRDELLGNLIMAAEGDYAWNVQQLAKPARAQVIA